MDLNLLETLESASSVSGRESSVCILKDYFDRNGIESQEDPLHSLVISGDDVGSRCLLTVPVDLPGFFVTYETPEGRIHVQPSSPSYPNHRLIGQSFFRGTEEWILCANMTPESAEKDAKSVSFWFDATDSAAVLPHCPGDAISVRTHCAETADSFNGLFCGTETLIALLADLCAARSFPGVTVGFTTRGYVASRGAKALVQAIKPGCHIALSACESSSKAVQILAKTSKLGYSDLTLVRKAEETAEANGIPFETQTETNAYCRDILGTAASSDPCPSLALGLPVRSEGSDTETVYKESLSHFRNFLVLFMQEISNIRRH